MPMKRPSVPDGLLQLCIMTETLEGRLHIIENAEDWTIIIRWLLRSQLFQLHAESSRNADSALSLCLSVSGANVNQTGGEIHVWPGELEQLTAADPGVKRRNENRPKMLPPSGAF